MSITRFTGPLLASGEDSNLPGYVSYNDTAGPSAFAHGVGILDSRFGPFNGGDVTNIIPMWYGADSICVVDQVPSALSATNIAAAQAGVAGAMTLAGASTGITVLSSALAFGQNTFAAGALMLDGNPAYISLAQLGGGISAYDPRTAVSRCVRITSVGNDTGATATVSGADFYGNPLHATVTMGNNSVVTTTKAFKAIYSVTLGGTLSGSNVSVGTSDVYEFPLACYEWPFADIYWNGTLITASTGFVAAVTTSPSTYTTGDVRGTYNTQSASDGTKKLQMFVTPQAWNNTSTGLFGVTQV